MAAEEDEAIAGMFADEDADDAGDADEEVMDFDEDQDGAHGEL